MGGRGIKRKTCKVGMLSFSQCCGGIERGGGGEGRGKGEDDACMHFSMALMAREKKRSNQIQTKKLLGGPLIR